jgi:hypothetical protein
VLFDRVSELNVNMVKGRNTMNLTQRLLWAVTATIALVGLQVSSRPIAPKLENNNLFSQIFSHLQYFGLIETADAKTVRYVPPSRRGAPARTQGGGSRGCALESTPVTILAPSDHVGLTTQARPTLFWYSANDSMLPMEISIVEPGVSEPIWVTHVQTGAAGFNQVQLPDTVPELMVGRRYRWTVTRLCNVRRPSNNTYARGWIERVKPDAMNNAVNKPTPTFSSTDRINTYAEAGIWYDAVRQAVRQALDRDADSQSALMALLEQGGLTRVVEQEQKRLQARSAQSPRSSSPALQSLTP